MYRIFHFRWLNETWETWVIELNYRIPGIITNCEWYSHCWEQNNISLQCWQFWEKKKEEEPFTIYMTKTASLLLLFIFFIILPGRKRAIHSFNDQNSFFAPFIYILYNTSRKRHLISFTMGSNHLTYYFPLFKYHEERTTKKNLTYSTAGFYFPLQLYY